MFSHVMPSRGCERCVFRSGLCLFGSTKTGPHFYSGGLFGAYAVRSDFGIIGTVLLWQGERFYAGRRAIDLPP